MTTRPRAELVGAVDAGAPHPGGQCAHHPAGRAKHALSRRLPQPPEQGTHSPNPDRSDRDGDGDGRRRPRGPRVHSRLRFPSRPAAGCGCTATDGPLITDSWRLTGPTYQLARSQYAEAGRRMSPGRSTAASMPGRRREIARRFCRARRWTGFSAWPEAVRARSSGKAVTAVRNAPDMTPVISAAVPSTSGVLLATDNDRTFTRTVRNQRADHRRRDGLPDRRFRVLLSMFLARTIVRPLRRLALAAHRVRLGRSREVQRPPPALAQRRDRPARPRRFAT